MEKFMDLKDFIVAVGKAKVEETGERYIFHLSDIKLPKEIMTAIKASVTIEKQVPFVNTVTWHIHKDAECLFQDYLKEGCLYIPIYPFNSLSARELGWDMIWIKKEDVPKELRTPLFLKEFKTALAYAIYNNLGGLALSKLNKPIGSLPVVRSCLISRTEDGETEIKPLIVNVVYTGSGNMFFEAEIPHQRLNQINVRRPWKLIENDLLVICEILKQRIHSDNDS